MQLTGNVQGILDFIGGGVQDVKVDGVSVVNDEEIAEITIPEAPVQDVTVDGVSVVNDAGVAEITIPEAPVQDVTVDGVSVVNDEGVAEITLPDIGVNYSTNEQVIGTWMGKPLYQKTVIITNQQVSQTMEIDFSQYISDIDLIWADLSHSHIDEILETKHYYRNFTEWKGLYDSVNAAKKIRYMNGVSYEARVIYNLVFTVQYTKTTDVD